MIFVHGCFWHCHECRWGSVTPKTRAAFWAEKRRRTTERDLRNLTQLRDLGWNAFVIWECETKSDKALRLLLLERLFAGEQYQVSQEPPDASVSVHVSIPEDEEDIA